MERTKRDWHTWLNTSVQLVTIGALVFWGGGLWQMVSSHENRLNNLEVKGSPGLKVHEVMDDERFGSLRTRVNNFENIVGVVADMRGDLRVIQTKLDKLNDDLEAHTASVRNNQKP